MNLYQIKKYKNKKNFQDPEIKRKYKKENITSFLFQI